MRIIGIPLSAFGTILATPLTWEFSTSIVFIFIFLSFVMPTRQLILKSVDLPQATYFLLVLDHSVGIPRSNEMWVSPPLKHNMPM
jgi:hypothetical protein